MKRDISIRQIGRGRLYFSKVQGILKFMKIIHSKILKMSQFITIVNRFVPYTVFIEVFILPIYAGSLDVFILENLFKMWHM